jgi:hypothetical protein
MTLERKQLKKEADQVSSRFHGRELGAEARGQILIGPNLFVDQTQGDQRLLTMRMQGCSLGCKTVSALAVCVPEIDGSHLLMRETQTAHHR